MIINQLQKIKIATKAKKYLADTTTPVSIYLKIRDHFDSSLLLESTDFRSVENCFSFVCMSPIASFEVNGKMIQTKISGQELKQEAVTSFDEVPFKMNQFMNQFEVEEPEHYKGVNGFFGYMSFEAVQYFDTLEFDVAKKKMDIPEINYKLFRYIIAINHFNDELYILENIPPHEPSSIEKIENILSNQNVGQYQFKMEGEEQSNITNDDFKTMVTKGKEHCQIGDVFQVVFSRQFQQQFSGDEFNVYRILRSVNPSPYLFFFDYGNYKIFGSSPEAQMVIKNKVASVNPIAGTYKRTGNDEEDRVKAQQLLRDPKENAEHMMLVDLARNDLSRHCSKVRVSELMDVQYFSHVIHLVSKVDGDLPDGYNPIKVLGDTFPAGTLSGAPKYKAIELINQYENQNRSFYGGTIGFVGFNGDLNHAITIRSFLSKNNTLYYQAGAGIVTQSDE
ncbi:MAG TPA: anthranilate synthase component I family protein, partial [Phaeodactylibacter sp.]|nr:anthranilate synthase component I family protein [Phaeodactylibacter sp.]